MNDTWHFLREFESKDLVKRYYKKKHDLELNSTKAYEISSAFIQGREYFSSYKKADISVQPLLLYYGIVSLSRGLILFLVHNSKENNLAPSHGLSIRNTSEIFSSKKYEDLELESSNGTFKELIKATNNKSYFRNASSRINTYITYDIPNEDFTIKLKEIAYNLPDLKQSVESWIGHKVPTFLLNNWIKPENDYYVLTLMGNHDKSICLEILPTEIFGELIIEYKENETILKFSNKNLPQTAQMWVSAFETCGDPFVTPPFDSGAFLNNISIMFSAAYIFGMISRYYPSTWNNINKGILNDSIFPFAVNLMDFLSTKYPLIVLDFLKAPYDFETK